MENIIINDSMVKESKIWKTPMIIFYILATIFPLVLIWKDIKTIESSFAFIAKISTVIPLLIRYKTSFKNNKYCSWKESKK